MEIVLIAYDLWDVIEFGMKSNSGLVDESEREEDETGSIPGEAQLMASTPLRQQLSIMRQSLFDEGLLDHEQVSYLETLENEDDPDFIENVFTLFLRDSTRYIDSIEKALETSPVDYPIMERMMYRFKGSSASIGASKINGEISTLRKQFRDGDMER
uniref:Histidine-containing phosphotransfer protein n=1 Tax=Salix viminalis TaxID=40686 RepID=A0A6N2N720_SALVM